MADDGSRMAEIDHDEAIRFTRNLADRLDKEAGGAVDPCDELRYVADLAERAKRLEEASREALEWLDKRIKWLTKEAHSGGNWEHLNALRQEAAYLRARIRPLLDPDLSAEVIDAALASKDKP